MKGVGKFSTYLKEKQKNEEFRKHFEEEEIYADIAIQVASLRQSKCYTQKDLAKLLQTTQQTISRIENPKNNSMSINTLVKLALFFRKGLRIEFV